MQSMFFSLVPLIFYFTLSVSTTNIVSAPVVLVTILVRLLDSALDGRPFRSLLGRSSLRLNR